MNKGISQYRRLIEVDLPIRQVSEYGRWEKKSVPGHIKQLHLWWARRPLAACRAVTCAMLWPDPADDRSPAAFVEAARTEMREWSKSQLALCSTYSYPLFRRAAGSPQIEPTQLRALLLAFIGDFSGWDAGSNPAFVEAARRLTNAAYSDHGTPTVLDPFAGGGSIPIEAARCGANAIANDLNPVAVLLNKVALEYVTRWGTQLAEAVEEAGRAIQAEAAKRLSEFYPATPPVNAVAYLWTRTISCEGPGCSAEVPLIRSYWLTKKAQKKFALKLAVDRAKSHVGFSIIANPKASELDSPTVRKGAATCPVCGFTTPVESVRRQLALRRGAAASSRLICVVEAVDDEQGRRYRIPSADDLQAVDRARAAYERLRSESTGPISAVPNEPLPPRGALGFRVQLYGFETWGDLHAPRQAVALCMFADLIADCDRDLEKRYGAGVAAAAQTLLALTFTKLVDICTSLSRWEPNVPTVQNLYCRQAVPMTWDFAEGVPIGRSRGSWLNYLEKTVDIVRTQAGQWEAGDVMNADAAKLPLPDDSVDAVFTDPPYYDAVPYSDLSDLFYVWLRRALVRTHRELFGRSLTPKDEECIVDPAKGKDDAFFEQKMRAALTEARRVAKPNGIGVVVFAHKSTAGWEAQLQAMMDAGWAVTASWPIDTENASRMRAQSSAALGSSVHIVCRPREDKHGLLTDDIGDWREVLSELPRRINEWMPRLASEGVVGADAIFACLGPALEVFSRYSRVEKASGESVSLSEYLEHVWAIVAREALRLVLDDADASGLEADGRLTAIWLWTITGSGTASAPSADDEGADDDQPAKATTGFVLDFDAARKLAQGLGAHLEELASLVEVSGETARLLPVTERARHLFAKGDGDTKTSTRKRKNQQSSLFADIEALAEESSDSIGAARPASTTLDRIHQSMILFGAGRGEALKRFLIEEGVGNQPQFWKLAQSLSALYPSGTDEKRWIDGVLARKKSFGFA